MYEPGSTCSGVPAQKQVAMGRLTFLLLADIAHENTLELYFRRYIYLHKDVGGKMLGVSVSRSIQGDLECSQYSISVLGKIEINRLIINICFLVEGVQFLNIDTMY